MAKTTATKNIAGFRFLCEILGIAYQPSQMKNTLLLRSMGEDPLSKEETRAIQNEFTELVVGVKKARRQLLGELSQFLSDCYPNAECYDFFEYANEMGNMYTGLFQNQTGTTNLPGIALTIVLAVGYSQNSFFYISESEARTILTKSMECLGYMNADFIPDSCFALNQDGFMDINMLRLMLLSLYGALKYKYPYKSKDTVQREKNLQKARETIESLTASDHDAPAFNALRNSAEMSRICLGMQDALREAAEQVTFPNGVTLPLTSFYSIPTFEAIGRSVPDILRRDYNSFVRSVVIGKIGSGKSLLAKAVARTCLEPAELRCDSYKEYADVLGLQNNNYFPLILRCNELPQDADIQNMDLIEEAVRQLVQLTRSSRHHSCLAHWIDFEPQIMEYYKHRAKNSSILLIIEDLSWFDRKTCDLFLQKIHNMEWTDYSRLHILIVSQRLLNSQMHHFRGYNCVEIAPLTRSLEQEIRTLVSLGLGCFDADYYIRQLDTNRHIRAFVDSPQHLIRLLCHPESEPLDLNALVVHTIDEQLERQFCPNISDSDCREFLTALAVSVAESQKRTGFSRGIYPMQYNSIPKNVVDRGCIAAVNDRIPQSSAVWQHIMDNMILVCPAGGINSYAFVNHNIYCSLAADHYISLLGTAPYPNWLDHFNRISSHDFSVIIVLMFERLCLEASLESDVPAEVSSYDVQLLIQSVAGYVLSRTAPSDIYNCLMALMDILTTDHIRRSFCSVHRENLWNILVQLYSHCYSRYREMSDDPVKYARLIPTDQLLQTNP